MVNNIKVATGSSHGKVILTGEHSVVYGHYAIAIPLVSNEVTTTITENDTGVILKSALYNGNIKNAPKELKHLVIVINKVFDELYIIKPHINIDINSCLPLKRGMGSSAAVVAATVRALYAYYHTELTRAKLFELTDFAENIAHGNSSGIDTRATIFLKPLLFAKGKNLQQINIELDAYLVIADTGIKGKTKTAVDHIKTNYPQNKKYIDKLAEYTNYSINAIKNSNSIGLGHYMTESHQTLKKLGVSHAQLDKFVETALKANALGAKLTGGGLGGCMIALASTSENAQLIANNLKKAGAVNTWIQKMKL